MMQLNKLSKIKNKHFENENLTFHDFVNKLTKKANLEFGYAVFYIKVSPNHQNISYNLIEKITVPLNN